MTPDSQTFQAMLQGLAGYCLTEEQKIDPPTGDEPRLFEFEVEDEALAIVYEPRRSIDRFTIACVLGSLPDTDRDQVLAQLLQVNHVIAGSGAMLSMDPFTEEVVLSTAAPVATPPAGVLHTMTDFAALAKRWREDRFLGMTGRADFASAALLA